MKKTPENDTLNIINGVKSESNLIVGSWIEEMLKNSKNAKIIESTQEKVLDVDFNRPIGYFFYSISFFFYSIFKIPNIVIII